jgi:hypothetical protein
MRKQLTDAGYANIFANMLGPGLETLVADEEGGIYGMGGLSAALMEAACNNLRVRLESGGAADLSGAFVLAPEREGELYITPEELSARVSIQPDAPLVIFIPEEHRSAAEARLAPGFFRPVDTYRTLEEMEQRLISRIRDVPVYRRVAALWTAHAIPNVPILRRIDYLINVISLCLAHEELGMFFHKLDLLPDRNPDVSGDFGARLTQNALGVAHLCDPDLPPAARPGVLGLADPDLVRRLVDLLASLPEVTPEALTAAVFAAEYEDEKAGLSFDRWRFAGEPGWT